MKYCEIPHCIIGIERNKPECIDLLTSLTREMKGVEVKGLPMRYPQGAEKTLVETCTGREVPQIFYDYIQAFEIGRASCRERV